MSVSIENEERQTREWYELYELVLDELEKFGTEDADEREDFWVDTDNFGTPQHKVYVRNLELLRPVVVKCLQQVLQKYSSWELVYAVSIPGMGDAWPDMYLIIRSHEIVDALQRERFPVDYRGLAYEGGRPPTKAELAYYQE